MAGHLSLQNLVSGRFQHDEDSSILRISFWIFSSTIVLSKIAIALLLPLFAERTHYSAERGGLAIRAASITQDSGQNPLFLSTPDVRGCPTVRICLPLVVLWAALLPSVFSPRPMLAQEQSMAAGKPPIVRAHERTAPINIDGRLNEPDWADAPAASNFVQVRPTEGAPPPESTEVRVLFDEEAIYVGARMHESDPASIRDQLVRRDQGGQYDYFEVMIDPNRDRQTGYLFRLGVAGNELDAFLFDDSRTDVDFDAVWESAARRDSLGWTAELRLPYSQFQYESSDSTQAWGVNFKRRRVESDSESYFALVSRTVDGRVSQFGTLMGIDVPSSGQFLELEPSYAPEFFRAPSSPRNPFFDGTDLDATNPGQFGLDLSYGLSPRFTLDATFNPSFGETEVDPAVVNLSAFETFFSEKRAFFIQEARIFDFSLNGGNELFFSRRIGRQDLQGSPPDEADFVDQPRRNTILGASKITGRTDGGLSVGVLGAVTQEETGNAHFLDQGRTEKFVAQPMVQTGVVRLQQEFRGGDTRVGSITTVMNRRLGGMGLDELTDNALSFGTDFEHNWGGANARRWNVSGQWAGTLVRGDEAAITRIQTNAQHFFQRPDTDRLQVDSTATSMFGYQWRLDFARQSAEHWTWDLFVNANHPNFAANDLGFNTAGERFNVGGSLRYQDIEPGPVFREWSARLFVDQLFRRSLFNGIFDAETWVRSHKASRISLRSNFEFPNNWEYEFDVDIEPRVLSDTKTRGGPLMTQPAEYGFSTEIETDPKRTLSVEPEVEYAFRGQDAGSEFETELDLTFRPTPRWEFSLGPELSIGTETDQFVASLEDPAFTGTFGERHLFATLDQTQFSMNTRVRVALNPDLSVQLFAQPLLSANDFDTFKQLARPASFDFQQFEEGVAETAGEEIRCQGGETCVADGRRFLDLSRSPAADFSFSEQDFNFRSLVGQLVLRWEYQTGSEFFFVWREDRASREQVGDLRFGRDFGELFRAGSEDRFTIKIQHYFDF